MKINRPQGHLRIQHEFPFTNCLRFQLKIVNPESNLDQKERLVGLMSQNASKLYPNVVSFHLMPS